MTMARLIMCMAAILLASDTRSEDAESDREPDITVTAERVDAWEMSFEDMEFVTRAIDCGKRLYEDGQESAAWPYLRMGAGYGDVDSQFRTASMLSRGKDVGQDWNAAVGWLGVAADGNVKPGAKKTLREAKQSLCDGRADCERQFEAIVAEYVRRYGRDASGMACRYAKGERGRGVSSFRVNRGSRKVVCEFPRLFQPRDVLADADLEAATGRPGGEPTVDADGTVRPDLAVAYPGTSEFAVRVPGGVTSRRGKMRCPDLGSGPGPAN